MQTDIFLQKALIGETKKALEGYTALTSGEQMPVNVYAQSLPAKKGKNDEYHFPFVLVCLDEESIEGYTQDGNIVSVYFLIGVSDDNPEKTGHFDLANIMNKMVDRFIKYPLKDSRYRLQFPITKKFQEDDTWPKFFAGMNTLWTVNEPQIEDTEYD